MPITYSQKFNQRPIGSEVLIVGEQHVVGTTGVGTSEPDLIKLVEVPLQETPSSVAVTGFTEVTTAPGTNEFLVDYASGRIQFHPSRNGELVTVTSYKGRGSIVDAVDVNELQGPVGVALDFDGEITAGHVKPISISTNPSHDFTFPNDVIVTGDLTVNGTTTTINTETVTIEDNIVLLNSNFTGPASVDAGLEVERGDDTNVQFIWNETNDSWQLKNIAGNPILEAFDTGDVTILGTVSAAGMSISGVIELDDGTVGLPSLTFTADTDTGLFRTSTNNIGFSAGGAETLRVTADGIYNIDGTVTNPSITFINDTDTGIYRITDNVLGLTTNGTEAVRINASQDVGIGVDPAAKLHNSGSTVLGLTTDTDPVSIPAATVDNFTGIVITTTGATTVTLPSPTNTTAGRFFTVLHDDGSSSTLSINGSNVGVGKGSTFMWDGSAWIPVGATGGFEVMAGDPGSPVTRDVWFDTTVNQFKGYNGTNNVILG